MWRRYEFHRTNPCPVVFTGHFDCGDFAVGCYGKTEIGVVIVARLTLRQEMQELVEQVYEDARKKEAVA